MKISTKTHSFIRIHGSIYKDSRSQMMMNVEDPLCVCVCNSWLIRPLSIKQLDHEITQYIFCQDLEAQSFALYKS